MQTMVVQLGLATIPFGMRVEVVLVDLWDHQGHVRVHPPRLGIVDHHGAGPGHHRCPLAGRRRPHAEQGDVDPAVVSRDDVLDLDAVQDLAGRTVRGEEPQPAHGEPALAQHLAHHAAHLAGGTVNTHCQRHHMPALPFQTERLVQGHHRSGRPCPPGPRR